MLVYKSRFLPCILGVWLIINCFAYLALSFTDTMLPQYEHEIWNTVSVDFGEVFIMLWLIMGAKEVSAVPRACHERGRARMRPRTTRTRLDLKVRVDEDVRGGNFSARGNHFYCN
jgi:hypothetical protein